ncbi:MAG: hypothetical protein ACOX0C_00480 [Patescibacteria group bacterium]|jgi:hypothetical protein
MRKKIIIWLLIIDLLLVGLHLLWGDQIYIFNLDYELTIPAYYSGLKLVTIGGLMFLIFKLASKRRDKILYFFLSAFFTILAFDEISELHENLGEYFLSLFSNFNIFAQASFMWVIYLSPIIIGVIALLSYYIYSLRKNRAFSFALVGLIAFILVIVLEFIGGKIIHLYPQLYYWEIVLEELLEMFGASFFLLATLNVFKEKFGLKYRPIEETK